MHGTQVDILPRIGWWQYFSISVYTDTRKISVSVYTVIEHSYDPQEESETITDEDELSSTKFNKFLKNEVKRLDKVLNNLTLEAQDNIMELTRQIPSLETVILQKEETIVLLEIDNCSLTNILTPNNDPTLYSTVTKWKSILRTSWPPLQTMPPQMQILWRLFEE